MPDIEEVPELPTHMSGIRDTIYNNKKKKARNIPVDIEIPEDVVIDLS